MSTFSRAITSPAIVARRMLPMPVRNMLSAAYDQALYAVAGLPPRRLRAWISPLWFGFKDTGRDQLEFFVEMAGLQPSHRVLDIACGVGRLAIPLATYLDDKGSYDGFDINEELIEWCREKIAGGRSNFAFQTADIATCWSPKGRFSVDQYRFPYADGRFDLAYAGSIFTHILFDGARNYLSQTARVLKPGGRFVSTWLVYNQRSMQLTSTRAVVKRNWNYDHTAFRVKAEDQPEASVAYDEATIRKMYSEAGLEILEPFRPDASYNAGRIPDDRSVGIHLHYALSIIAIRPE
jgi:ubiquinone/menaquinone biosynthesis C-methylase UbiE